MQVEMQGAGENAFTVCSQQRWKMTHRGHGICCSPLFSDVKTRCDLQAAAEKHRLLFIASLILA